MGSGIVLTSQMTAIQHNQPTYTIHPMSSITIAISAISITPTKTVINPSANLLRAAGNPPVRYVRTCFSNTCSCFSHDSGYYSAEVPADLPTFKRGGSPHSHHNTELLDERGELVKELDEASNGSRAPAREYAASAASWDIARTALCLYDGGFGPPGKCRAEAEALASRADREARKERRAQAIKTMEAAGIPAHAAHALYGAGRWSNELTPEEWLALARLGHETLSRAANARSSRELDFLGLPVAGSHPRRTAWAAYAATAFFGGVLELPARETWRDIARRKGVTVR